MRRMHDFTFRRLMEVVGIFGILLAVALAAALLDYHVQDPSWNTATSAPASNILGYPGAWVADILLQVFGLASGLIVPILFLWSVRMIRKQEMSRWRWRVAASCLTLILAAPVFSLIGASVPLPASAGGWVGEQWQGILSTAPVWILVGLAVATGGAFVFACALTWRQWLYAMMWMGRSMGTLARMIFRRKLIRSAPSQSTSQRRVVVSRRKNRARASILPLSGGGKLYIAPPLTLLKKPTTSVVAIEDEKAFSANADLLLATLQDFGVAGKIVQVRPGPIITLYEFVPAPGTKASRVINLADDIARSMSAVSARIAPIAGRNALGIELPNRKRETVLLRELLQSEDFSDPSLILPIALGKDIGGTPLNVDLATMPHLLIAGTTGSGKSVAVNAMILSLLYRLGPHQCKLILIDPKMLEMSAYDGIPHLIAPVVVDPKGAITALKWTVREMERRYRVLSEAGVRNIATYNRKKNDEKGDDGPMPLIVVVVDEMADLMMSAGKEIEIAMQRLSQMARASGIHIIMATQRPSVDVITGVIKANFPTRISFQVTSRIDSRTVLGEGGAEQLLGMGDMLYMTTGGRIIRAHGPFVGDDEVEAVVTYLKKKHSGPEYMEEVLQENEDNNSQGQDSDSEDDLYQQACAIILGEGRASTSFIQRRLQIGYNRAARMMEKMEADGIVSPPNHAGKRDVLSQ